MPRTTIKDSSALTQYSGELIAHQTIFDVDKHYLGTMCRRSHDLLGTGRSARYRSTDGCVACLVESGALARLEATRERLSLIKAVPVGMKRCPRCESIKSIDCFCRNRSSKDGRGTYCGECQRSMSQIHRDANRELYRLRSEVARKKKSWVENLIRGSKSSAKARGLLHEINNEDLIHLWDEQGGKCYWLGLKLGDETLPNRHPLKPSLDRLDTAKGYIKGNVVISSTFANLGRSNTPPDVFFSFVESMRNNFITMAGV